MIDNFNDEYELDLNEDEDDIDYTEYLEDDEEDYFDDDEEGLDAQSELEAIEIEEAFEEAFADSTPPTIEEMRAEMESNYPGYDLTEDATDIDIKKEYLGYLDTLHDDALYMVFPNGRDEDAEDEDGPFG